MTCHAAFAGTLVPAKKRNLPNKILRAFDNAKHLPGLSRTVRDTLAEICRFVPQTAPFSTVFAHKDKIAERIGASERTIYRHLNKLTEEGLIEVLDQERKSRNGRFSVARIKLTKKAAELLGLIETAHAVEAPGLQDIHSKPSDNMTAGHTLTVPTFTKSQPTQFQNGLPVDLSWMTGSGVSKAGIFGLMAKAKKHGKLLSDIVIAVWQYIRDLKGGRLYSYLLKLIVGPSDFASLASKERQRLQEEVKHKLAKAKEKAFKERFKGISLTTVDQKKLYVIDKNCAFVQVYNGGFIGTQPMNNLSYWISLIESGKLVLATKEIEAQILSAQGSAMPPKSKKQVTRQQENSSVAERIRAYRHKQFVGPNGLRVKIFENLAEISHENGLCEHLTGSGLARLFDEIETGVLQEVDGFQDVNIKKVIKATDLPQIEHVRQLAMDVQETYESHERRLQSELAAAKLPIGRAANMSLLKSILRK